MSFPQHELAKNASDAETTISALNLLILNLIIITISIFIASVIVGPFYVGSQYDRYGSIETAQTIVMNIPWLMPIALLSVVPSAICQYFLLRRAVLRLPLGWWMIASILSAPVGWISGLLTALPVIRTSDMGIGIEAVISFGFGIGFVVGIAQSIVLRRCFRPTGWWIVISAFSWIISYGILDFINLIILSVMEK